MNQTSIKIVMPILLWKFYCNNLNWIVQRIDTLYKTDQESIVDLHHLHSLEQCKKY